MVPGSLSKYSKEARDETDILKVSLSQFSKCYRFIIVRGESIVVLKCCLQPGRDISEFIVTSLSSGHAISRDVVGLNLISPSFSFSGPYLYNHCTT